MNDQWIAQHRSQLAQRLQKNTRLDPASGCLLWQLSLKGGFGVIYIDRRPIRAHRAAFALAGHSIDDVVVAQRCGVAACVNPEHLEGPSVAESVLRGAGLMAAHARRTHCPRGHEYSTENTMVTKTGARRCRVCKSEENREYRERTANRRRRHDGDVGSR